MAKYTVKTTDNRNLVIEADSYGLDYTQTSYEFTKDGNKVATIPASPYVFAILLNDVEESDYYWVYDWNEEENKENETETETDDGCLDCRFQEFLESEEFFNEVYGIVEAYHSPDDYGDVPDPLPEPLTIYKATTPKFPEGAWGFWYADEKKGDVFVPFGVARSSAEAGLKRHNNGERGWDNAGWNTYPLSEATPVEEPVQ